MSFVIELLVNAGILFLLASIIPGIVIRNYGTAIGVCLLIGLLNATIGLLLRVPLNMATLLLLSFLARLLVATLLIRFAGRFAPGFEVNSWTAAFILALTMAVTALAIDKVL